MCDIRIIGCVACDGEGRIYEGEFDEERCIGDCPYCEGTGGEIVTTEPITLEDLDHAYP
jgi:hypothetical protein